MKVLRVSGRLALAAAAVFVVTFAGAGPVSAGPEVCNTGGRAICITVTDTDNVSPSTLTASHFMRNVVTVRNSGGSTLTNLTVRLTLTDRLEDQSTPPSTADYVEAQSSSACSETATASHILSCSAPNLSAGGSVTFSPLVFRTSTTADVVSTRMLVEVSAKERGNDQPNPTDPTNEQFSAFEDTLLEGDPNAQRSWAFPGAFVTLSTAKVGQFSTFPVRVPATFGGSFVAELVESPASQGFCPTCFGEQLTTVAPGVFSASNVVEIQSVVPLADVPRGVTEKGLVVHHKLDSGQIELITARCGGAIDSGTPPASALSCARVSIDKKLGTLTVEAFSGLGNGVWGFS